MPTKMQNKDWDLALEAFRFCLPRCGAKAKDDRLFLEALHYFTVHNISWRALPEQFGNWNSIWRRFDRLSRAGVFEDMMALLAECSRSAHLVQMFDSTVVRAHVSAAGAKGSKMAKPSVARAAGSRPKSTSKPTMTAIPSPST